MKNRIYIQQWLKLKPLDKSSVTDSYYLQLSNKIKDAVTGKNLAAITEIISEDEFDLMCCFLTAYLEDIVSEVNIWKTFVNKHFELYGKKLPFYDTDEYFDDEVNIQDVYFLIWYFINSCFEKGFINPYNKYIQNIGNTVFLLLDEAFEYAPENLNLKYLYKISETETNYYKIRGIADKLIFQSWLFFPDTGIFIENSELEIINNFEKKDAEHSIPVQQENRDNFVNTLRTRLLNMTAYEWTAELSGKKHRLYKSIKTVYGRIKGFFYYLKYDNKYIYLEHIASGKMFNLIKSSYEYYDTLKKNDVIYLGMVNWQNEWHFSGITYKAESDYDFINELKSDFNAIQEVNFTDYNKPEYKKILEEQYNAFLEYNNNSEIKYLHSSEVDDFIQGFTEFYNKTVKAEKNFKDEKLKNILYEKSGFSDIDDSMLVFYSKNSGLEVITGVNSAFPAIDNPFFDEEKSEENLAYLLFSDDTSKDLAMYCFNNYKDKLSYFKTDKGKKNINDIDFILRFFKREKYFPEPTVLLIDTKN